jgi:hypothetical protein
MSSPKLRLEPPAAGMVACSSGGVFRRSAERVARDPARPQRRLAVRTLRLVIQP